MKVELIAVHEVQTREPRDKEVKVHTPGSKFSVEQEDADRLLALGAAVPSPVEAAQKPSDARDEDPEPAKTEPAKAEPPKGGSKGKAKKDLLG